jgi:hypothetical protein
MRRTGAVLLGAVGLIACATVRTEHVLTGTPGDPFSGEVKIAMEGTPLAGDYDEVAIVTSMGTGASAALPVVLSALRHDAATLGCNAVVHVRYDRGAASASATGVAVRTR